MKRLSTLLLLAILINTESQAQAAQRMMQRRDERHKSKSESSCPRVYIGFSTGLNNPVGIIGPQIDFAINPGISVGPVSALAAGELRHSLKAVTTLSPATADGQ